MTTKPSHPLLPTALAVAASMLLAACGGGDAKPPPGSAPPPDTTPPTLTITDSEAGASATGPVTFTFSFSESVGSSFTDSDIKVTGGEKGTMTMAEDGRSATLVVTPTADTIGVMQVEVAEGSFADAAGNQNAEATTASQNYSTSDRVQMTLPVNFESSKVDYGLVGFAGAEASTIVDDPENASNRVAKVVRAAGAESYAGTTITTGTGDAQLGFATKIPFTSNDTKMSVRVWSPTAGITVRLKVEDHLDATKSVETDTTTTKAKAWETLTFDFAKQAAGTPALNVANSYDKATIFFDFGRAPADAKKKTYYFDNLRFVPGEPVVEPGDGTSGNTGTCTTAPCIDFSSASVGFEAFEGLVSAGAVKDPSDAANKVMKLVKAAAGKPWAGVTVYTDASDKSVDRIGLPTSKIITLRVYSPAVGERIMLKIEDAANTTVNMEAEATTTKAGEWETLRFDFGSPTVGTYDPSKTYDKVSVFPGFMTQVDKTYYFDELKYSEYTGGDEGGGGDGQVDLVAGKFSSNYSKATLPWKSTEGGEAGNYIDPVATLVYQYGDVDPTGDNPNFYFGYGIKAGATKPEYFGGYVKAPGNGIAKVSPYSKIKFFLGGNTELMSKLPTLTVVLNGPTVGGCSSELTRTFSVVGAAVQPYTLTLAGFTLTKACAYTSVANALAAGIAQFNVQAVGSNIQSSTFDAGGAAGGAYPNGMNVGTITFE
jgi:Bacterial Ig-like domain